MLRPPDAGEALAWLAAGDVRWLTLAPELPGALELVELLVARGVRVSVGHTDASWAQAEAAAGAGATLATHVFNAMRPLRHRDPGVVGYALASSLAAGFIADGHPLAFETIRLLARVKAPDELFLVTDALAGLGMPPGRYRLAGREYVSDGTGIEQIGGLEILKSWLMERRKLFQLRDSISAEIGPCCQMVQSRTRIPSSGSGMVVGLPAQSPPTFARG